MQQNDGYVHAWTDGSCPGNGLNATRGGRGVYFKDNTSWNISERVDGPTTNSSMEIQAARRACEIARSHGVRRLKIHTDSEFLVNSVNDLMHTWKQNGWRKTDGSSVVNKDDFQALDRAMSGMDVKFEHVRGHAGNYENTQADLLARKAAGI
ncbi:ribonuclease H1-like [Lutzomyia longipalpis]|uniref:ribonuclease H1-like n=1 Tax=Lutzomyia longipalpis TaxID=7200 RepID=UPI0024839CE4|nr:ribonuclease H1-like [Lutzomyia longipalpis]